MQSLYRIYQKRAFEFSEEPTQSQNVLMRTRRKGSNLIVPALTGDVKIENAEKAVVVDPTAYTNFPQNQKFHWFIRKNINRIRDIEPILPVSRPEILDA